MAGQPVAIPQTRAWLVSQSDSLAAIRYALGDGAANIGRGPQNDVVIQGSDVASVSLQHLEIRREGAGFRIRDLDSTNGTYLNGERITEADLSPPAVIRLGSQGPELAFVTEEPPPAEMDRTQAIPEGILPPQPVEEAAAPGGTYEGLLSEAVARARHARVKGIGDQTMTIMRETLRVALRHTSRRLHLALGVLVLGLAATAGGAAWKIASLNHDKRAIDQHIHDIETQLAKTTEAPAQSDRLITQLADYQNQAEQLEHSLLYRYGLHEKEDFLTGEIRTLLAEFGAEVYSVPPEFTERVGHYIEQYQGPDRPLIAKALNGAAPQIKVMRQILEREQLPPDLAYIPLVESALAPGQSSAAGAFGPWQLTATTGRALGLRIDKETDERTNLVKSTRASCHYLRELILDFGSGSSVMLALAAYDLGPTKVKQAIMATVHDPIKQRSFWYLYRVNALPKETREYVPKVVAAMIIGRNPQHFGF
jgi:hypothetical protein